MSDNRAILLLDPVEQWLYFFTRAEESTAEELLAKLPDPVFAEAAGVLEMIAKNPEDRRLYQARLKMERDERARMRQAREEGREEGIEIGQAKVVQVLQELLGEPVQPADELTPLGLETLMQMESELRHLLRERR